MRKEGGFALPEVLVAMTLMVVVLFALYAIFDMSIKVFGFGNDKVEAVENARLGLEKMEREIRAAYPYDKPAGQDHLLWSPGYPATGEIPPPDRISFGNDLDGNRKIECPPPPAPSSTCETITYDVYRPGGGATDALGRTKSSGGVRQPVAGYLEDVSGDGEALTFEYLDRLGNPATSEAEVAMVRIELEVGVNGRTQTLATQVALRNRMQ
ncbi:MAG: prepilin-type N-terminal cleavage/methylation domain-containing protein [Actinobacteria bacterium]|nr:prepilin-type N-terminal cleavage/methylation domain-containing protein [Actinomycetota bacterium]